ncbi:hypothetical protein VNO80_13369 [Phaseolus coccineus]|uniref:Uncharacterized protein n=1 Tax=Phaseolus coccineus TaxID=3886 RepID=A0AAN9N6J8_PHACN
MMQNVSTNRFHFVCMCIKFMEATISHSRMEFEVVSYNDTLWRLLGGRKGNKRLVSWEGEGDGMGRGEKGEVWFIGGRRRKEGQGKVGLREGVRERK